MPANRLRLRRLALVGILAAALVSTVAACDPRAVTPPPAVSTEKATPSTDYAVALKDADGTVVRWNPCAPVRYMVNLTHAPAFAVAEAQRAAAEIERVSGLDLQYAGTTTVSPKSAPLRTATGFAPILISFQTATEFPFASTAASGFGTGLTAVDSTGHRQYVSGLVVLRPTGWTQGTTTTNPLSLMLQHELGHVMGLAHAPTTKEIMGTGGNGTMRAWGAGDLVGFQKVGRPAGCRPTIS